MATGFIGFESFEISAQVAISGAAIPIVVDTLSPDQDTLRFDWRCRLDATSNPDECSITIYNLSPEVRAFIANAPAPLGMMLAIGWGGVPRPVFEGPRRTRDETGFVDVTTTIDAMAYIAEEGKGVPGGTEVGAAAISLTITEARKLGHIVTPPVVALVAQEAAKLGITAWKSPGNHEPKTLLDWLFATLDLKWSVDSTNNCIAVYKHGLRADLGIVVLGPTTGLLSATPVDDEGIDFEGLAQPRIVVPGCALQFAEAGQFGIERPTGPPLRCESVEFTGSTYGSSTMRGTARRIEVTK